VAFFSHKFHCVDQVTKGTRRVLVVEFWRGPERSCPHRCEWLGWTCPHEEKEEKEKGKKNARKQQQAKSSPPEHNFLYTFENDDYCICEVKLVKKAPIEHRLFWLFMEKKKMVITRLKFKSMDDGLRVFEQGALDFRSMDEVLYKGEEEGGAAAPLKLKRVETLTNNSVLNAVALYLPHPPSSHSDAEEEEEEEKEQQHYMLPFRLGEEENGKVLWQSNDVNDDERRKDDDDDDDGFENIEEKKALPTEDEMVAKDDAIWDLF
jgi:hypothetical protein